MDRDIKPVICLMGPTACGKTALAKSIHQQLPVEVISVDSAMIYRGMDIGTAKPTREELVETPHHLIDILDPTDTYSSREFYDEALRLCQDIQHRGRIPLLVGGTMMYFHALQQGLSILPSASQSVRETLQQNLQQFGISYLYQQLEKVDPVSAARIHCHDIQRIQRALEVYLLTGKARHQHAHVKTPSALRFVNIILMPDQRAWLHDRIASRFLIMLKQGLVDEVRALLDKWQLHDTHPAMRAVGYRQVYEYLRDGNEYDVLLSKGVAATRQLAKRQMTWLRHWKSPADYFVCDGDYDLILNKIIDKIKEHCYE